MKKLFLGLALTLFLGTYTVSANNDNPPQDKAKTEAKAEKKECTTAEKKACSSEKKATASTEAKCCKSKSAQTASTK